MEPSPLSSSLLAILILVLAGVMDDYVNPWEYVIRE